MQPLITFGMATYREFDSTWATVNSLRLNLRQYPDAEKQFEFIVVNNDPKGPETELLAGFFKNIRNGRLINYGDKVGTSVRDEVFRQARGLFTFCMDSHVLFEKDTLWKLAEFVKANQESQDLYQGPLLYDDLHTRNTHLNPIWGAGMYGKWGCDKLVNQAQPFEIESQGLGLFGCRTDAWLGFNPLFRGFGGEEFYIHEKFRKAGRKCWCLPFLEWTHKFRDKQKVHYPNTNNDRIHNYFVGWYELGLNEDSIIEHFSAKISRARLLQLQQEAHNEWDNYLKGHNMSTNNEPCYTPSEFLTIAEAVAKHLLGIERPQAQIMLTELARSNRTLYLLVSALFAEMRGQANAG